MLNKTVVMGRLTNNPELRETATGVKVCTFSVAVERDYKVNREQKTDFSTLYMCWRLPITAGCCLSIWTSRGTAPNFWGNTAMARGAFQTCSPGARIST